jgi:hypothetical protein
MLDNQDFTLYLISKTRQDLNKLIWLNHWWQNSRMV